MRGPPLKHLVKPAPDLMSRLLKIHGWSINSPKPCPDILSLPEVARALEQELLLVMIRCLTGGEPKRMTPAGRRHDMIIVRSKTSWRRIPTSHCICGDMRGRLAWRSEHCGSPARSTWGWAQFVFFLAEDASCPSRTATGRSLDETVTRVAH